jgi:hypothetical protein
LKDLLASLTDSYSRVARFYPAVLAFFPIVWTVPALLPKVLSFDVPHVVGITAVLSAGAALLMNMARSLGKSTEKRLLSSWGGWPSTIMLRYRDTALDSGTKGRYHAKLQALKDIAMPSAAEEARDEAAADAQYRAATTRLIELRRDAKYKMLHKENAQYGLRRNLLGLKPVALTVALLATGVTGAAIALGLPSQIPLGFASLVSDAGVRWQLYVTLLLDVSYVLLFLLVVRPHFVRQAGDEYALALFRTLD